MANKKKQPTGMNDTGSAPRVLKIKLPALGRRQNDAHGPTTHAETTRALSESAPGLSRELPQSPVITGGAEEKKLEVKLGLGGSDSDIELVGASGNSNHSLSDSFEFVHSTPKSFNGRKRKRAMNDDFDDDLSDTPPPIKLPLKKTSRNSVPKPKETSKDGNARVFTVYLQAAKTTTTTTSITKGPFKFDTSRSFAEFQSQVAETLPCRKALLPVTRFEWKFDKEARTAPRKKIADDAGFEALIDAIAKKRVTENVVVWLHLPKPAKDENDWDTGHSDHVDHPFDFDEERNEKTTKELIDEMAKKRSTAMVALENEYPVGKIPAFEGKRVWKNATTGSYFELNPMRLKVWANSIASGNADLSAPPTSAHFAEDKRMKVVPAAVGPSAQATGPSIQSPDAQHFPGYAPPSSSYHPYYPPHYIPYMPPPGLGYPYPYPPPPTAAPGALPPASPGTATLAHNVSLAEFCEEYRISENDQLKLEKLEYRPGNRDVEQLDEKDWREFASFTSLGWKAFLTAHRDFCTAIRSRRT